MQKLKPLLPSAPMPVANEMTNAHIIKEIEDMYLSAGLLILNLWDFH
jgi:hypothetical protein